MQGANDATNEPETSTQKSASRRPFTVDIHTHIYPQSYIQYLQSRSSVPYIYTPPARATAPAHHATPPATSSQSTTPEPRLIILPTDDDASLPPSQRGRPLTRDFASLEAKLHFMDTHQIDVSVISLANPWLDFLDDVPEAARVAKSVNDDFEAMCAGAGDGRLFAFGTLPLRGTVEGVVREIKRLKTLAHVRGVIMGTTGLGRGLDDEALDPVWAMLEQTRTLVFLHPHYGLPSEAYATPGAAQGRGHERYGHVLPLAIGFPVETTIAVAKMWLASVFDRFSGLRLLLAHSGGTLPFLAGRLESCLKHDRVMREQAEQRDDETEGERRKRSIWETLEENIYLDAVAYSSVGLKCAIEASGRDGWQRLMFGTDHPFFPPLGEEIEAEWASVTLNVDAVEKAFPTDEVEKVAAVMGSNAARILQLPHH